MLRQHLPGGVLGLLVAGGEHLVPEAFEGSDLVGRGPARSPAFAEVADPFGPLRALGRMRGSVSAGLEGGEVVPALLVDDDVGDAHVNHARDE